MPDFLYASSSGLRFENWSFVCFSIPSSRFLKIYYTCYLVKFINRVDMNCTLYQETGVPCLFWNLCHSVVRWCCCSGHSTSVFWRKWPSWNQSKVVGPIQVPSSLLRPSNWREIPCRSVWQSPQRHDHPGLLPETQVNTEALKTKPMLSLDTQNNQ